MASPNPPEGLGDYGLRFWAAWSETPQASVFTDEEWERLADAARLYDQFFAAATATERLELSQELRRRMDEFGFSGAGPLYEDTEP